MANVNPIREMSGILGAVSLGDEIAAAAGLLRELQAEDTAAGTTVAATKPSSGGSFGESVLSTVESVFGLGLNPLVSGLVGLFGGGGGDEAQPAPLIPYVAPPSVNVSAGYSSSATGIFAVDGSRPAPSANVTVQVQAFDSKSFLDHSQEIAMAVRQAMLESTALNDVIREV